MRNRFLFFVLCSVFCVLTSLYALDAVARHDEGGDAVSASGERNDGKRDGNAELAVKISIFSLAINILLAAAGLFTTITGEKKRVSEIFQYYLAKYSSPEMENALQNIASVDVDAWINRDADSEKWNKINQSRRFVKFFLYEIYRLHKLKVMPTKCLQSLCELKGIRLYLGKIRKMDTVHDKNRPVEEYVFYERFCRKHGIDIARITPVPPGGDTEKGE